MNKLIVVKYTLINFDIEFLLLNKNNYLNVNNNFKYRLKTKPKNVFF